MASKARQSVFGGFRELSLKLSILRCFRGLVIRVRSTDLIRINLVFCRLNAQVSELDQDVDEHSGVARIGGNAIKP
jgi:hypothetical protein